jgi:hypothetical protein
MFGHFKFFYFFKFSNLQIRNTQESRISDFNSQEISKFHRLQKPGIQIFKNTNFRHLTISKHLIFDSMIHNTKNLKIMCFKKLKNVDS